MGLMVKKIIMVLAAATLYMGAVAQGALGKGLNAEAKGLGDLAEGYYRTATDTSSEARLRLGLLLERKYHYSEAAHWLAQADTTAESMAHLALCQGETKLWDDAKRSAEKSIELADTSEDAIRSLAMSTLALVYAEEQNHTNALMWAHKATEADPQSARALNVTGIVLFKRGNENDAIQQFRQALKLDPRNIDAYFNLGTIYCYRNNFDLAITTLRKGLQQERRSTKLFYCLGWAFMLKGDTQKAIECLQSVIEIDSGYVNAYNRLGDIHFQRAEYNQALEQYRKAIRIAPDMSEAYRLKDAHTPR